MSLMHHPNQSKPGLVSMSNMINLASLKIYTDFQQLVEVIKSQGDSERKTEIVNFLSTSRSLLIRIQALNKWTTSAIKVDKCEKISNLLDEQSSVLFCTARQLSILARDKLPMARLPNSMPIIAADIFTTKTYSRLPNQIRLSVLQTKPICRSDKLRMFDELNRILRIRLSNTKIPYRMRNIQIKDGRVKFRVENEFEVICTLMSDHFESPWRLLNINILVKGNDICRGRSLVHKNHLKDMHRQVQSRLQIAHTDNYTSLYHLYDMLHSMSLGLQLEVLNEQLHKYCSTSKGLNIFNVVYMRGYKLSFSYWKTNESINRVIYTVIIFVDDEDPRKPLKLRHTPSFVSEEFRSEYIVDSSNLSITNIILQTLTARIYSCLKMIEKMLLPFVSDVYKITKDEAILKIPILSNAQKDNIIKITVKRSNGIIECQNDLSVDFLPYENKVRINKVMVYLNMKLNELYMKTLNHSKYLESTEITSDSIETREIITIRRQIAEYFAKLKVIVSAYGCFLVLQKSGMHNLQVISNKPNLEMGMIYKNSALSELREKEAKNECELIYLPLDNNSNNYLVVSCEIKHRNRASYRFFYMSTTAVFASQPTGTYGRKCYVKRPSIFVYVKSGSQTGSNCDTDEPKSCTDVFGESNPDNSSILTCHDLLKKKLLPNQSKDESNSTEKFQSKIQENEKLLKSDIILPENDINDLPTTFISQHKMVLLKSLNQTLVNNNFYIKYTKTKELPTLVHCNIIAFPYIKSCSEMSNLAMKKLLKQAIVYGINDKAAVYDLSEVKKWSLNIMLKNPFFYLKNWFRGKIDTHKVVSLGKEFETLSNNEISIRYISNFWEHLVRFTEACICPLLQKNLVGTFRVIYFDYEKMEISYGQNCEYILCIRSPQKSLEDDIRTSFDQPPTKVLTKEHQIDQSDDPVIAMNTNITIELKSKRQVGVKHGFNSHFANPHYLVTRHLEQMLNRTKDLYLVLELMEKNAEFLHLLVPYHDKSIVATASSINSIDNMVSGGNNNIENPDNTSVSASLSNSNNSMCKNNSIELLRKYVLMFSDLHQVNIVYRERFALRIVYDASEDVVRLEDAFKNFHACNMSIQAMPEFSEFVAKFCQLNTNKNQNTCGLQQLAKLLCRKTRILESYFETCFKLNGRSPVSIAIPNVLLNPTSSTSTTSTNVNTNAPQQQGILLHPLKGVNIKMIYDAISFNWTLIMQTLTQVKHEAIKKESAVSIEDNMMANLKSSPKDSVEDSNKVRDFIDLAIEFFNQKIKGDKCMLGVSRIQVFRNLLTLPSLRLQKNLFTILTQAPIKYEKEPAPNSSESSKSTVWTIKTDLDWTCLRTEPIICQKQDSSSIYLRFVVIATHPHTQDQSITTQKSHHIWSLSMHYAAKSNDISLLEDGTDSTIIKLGIDKQVNELYLVSDDDTDTPIPSFFVNLLDHIKRLL